MKIFRQQLISLTLEGCDKGKVGLSEHRIVSDSQAYKIQCQLGIISGMPIHSKAAAMAKAKGGSQARWAITVVADVTDKLRDGAELDWIESIGVTGTKAPSKSLLADFNIG